jgi:hypothetical protein
MHPRFKLRKTVIAACTALACAGTTLAIAATKHDCPDPTKEQREQMAVAHEQMAACLRSDKTISECHEELSKSQHHMMGCLGAKMHPHAAQKQEN